MKVLCLRSLLTQPQSLHSSQSNPSKSVSLFIQPSPQNDSTGCSYLSMCLLNHFSHVRLCNPTDCSPPGSSVRGVLQARILEWVATPSSRGSSQLRDPTRISMSPALAVAFFTASATWEARGQSRKTRHRQVVMALCLPLQHQLLLSDPNAPHVSSPFWALSWPAPSVGCSSLFPILLIWKKPVYGPDFTALCSRVSSPWKSFPSHPF